MKHYVRDEWDVYATIVLAGKHASQEMRDEMKKAFYAGWATCLKTLNQAMQPGMIPTDQDIKVIDQIVKELKQWGATQKRIEAREQEQMKPPGPVQAEIMRHMEGMARRCAKALDEATDNTFEQRALGFALFLFSFAGSELTYISNADRPNMIKVMHEFLAANPPAMTWDEQHG